MRSGRWTVTVERAVDGMWDVTAADSAQAAEGRGRHWACGTVVQSAGGWEGHVWLSGWVNLGPHPTSDQAAQHVADVWAARGTRYTSAQWDAVYRGTRQEALL